MRNIHSTEHSLVTQALATALATMTAFTTLPAWAGPTGEQVVSGSASFVRDGVLTQITAGNNAIISYDSFDVAAGETVQFIQPDAAARVLNRIGDAHPTQIDGSLIANGRVYLVNAAGVYFGSGAVVDVGALYAAAGALSDADFLARRDRFTQLGGAVVNLGAIRGDVVSLLGAEVANRGSITSPGGMIALIAGNEVVLVPVGERVRVRVAGGPGTGAATPGVLNAGTLDAGAGEVQLAAGDFYSLAIQQSATGSIRAARAVIEGQGAGTVAVSGAIDASGASGGDVAVLGEHVRVANARIDASGATGGGTILVGGDYQGATGTRTSKTTTVARDALLRADAVASGDGGKVVVWSDGDTRFSGAISARGGAAGGNGGIAETSGKLNLAFDGAVDLGAANGASGSLLLDPRDIDIVDAAPGANDGQVGPGDGTVALADGGSSDFEISKTALQAVTGNISLQASRNISVKAGATLALANQANGETVTFTANNDITIDAAITTGGGSLILQANEDAASGGNVAINSAITTNGGGVTLRARTGGDVSVGATVTTGNGNFQSNHNAFTLSAAGAIDAGTGDVTLTGASGATTIAGAISADALTVSGATTVALPTLASLGSLDVDGSTSITLNGDVTTTGAQRYRAPVLLAGNRTLASTANGGIQFDATVDSASATARDLTVNTGGVTTFSGDVGSNDALDTLATDDAGSLVLAADVITTGGQLYADDAISLGGRLFDTGTGIDLGDEASDTLAITAASLVDVSGSSAVAYTLDNATTLGADLEIDSGAKNLTITGTVNDDGSAGTGSDLALTSTGAIAIDAAIGGTSAVQSVTSGGGGSLALNANVTTTGGQTYTDSAIALAAVTLSDTGAGSIALGTSGASDTLAVNGAATISNSGGGSLTLNTVTTLAADLTLNGGTGALNVENTIDGPHALALNGTGTGANKVTVNADIGSGVGNALTTVTSDNGGEIDLNQSVSTTGGQTYADSIISIASNTLTTTTGGITIGNAASDTVTFTGGGATTTIDTSAANGQIALNASATLGRNLVLSSGTADLTIAGNLQDDGNGSTSSDLVLNSTGVTTLSGTLGGSTTAQRLESVTTNAGGTLALTGTVRTTDGQQYNEAAGVTLGSGAAANTLSDTGANGIQFLAPTLTAAGDTTLSTTGAALNLAQTITLAGDLTLDAGSNALTLSGAIDDDGNAGTSSNLTLSSTGTTTIGVAVGATQAIESLTSNDGGTVNVNAGVRTTVSQSYLDTNIAISTATLTAASGDITIGNSASDSVTFGGVGTATVDTSAGNGQIALNASATLGRDLTLTSGAGDLTVAGTLKDDGSALTTSNLVLNSTGATTLSGNLGTAVAGERLTSVTTDVGGTLAVTGNVRTSGGQFYRETTSVSLGSGAGANTLSDTSASFVQFDASDLVANGDTTLSSAGGVAAIAFDETTTLVGNLTLDGGANAVVVTGAIDGDASGATSSGLTLRSDLNPLFGPGVTVSSAIGATTAVGSLTTAGAGSVSVAANVTTTNGQSYDSDGGIGLSAVTLADTGAGSIRLGNAGSDTVVVNGAATVSNAGGGTIDLNAATTLGADLTLNGGSGDIDVDGSVNGAHALALNSTGVVDVNGAIGGTTALASLTSDDGGRVNVNSAVATTGDLTLSDSTIDLGVSSLATTGAGAITIGNASSDTVLLSGATTLDTSAGTGDIAVNASATLNADLTLNAGANDIVLAGNIEDDGSNATSSEIALNSTGATTIAGTIGAANRIESVTTDAGGSLAIDADVATRGGQTYQDATIAIGGAGSRLLSDTGAGGIAIGAVAGTLAINAATTLRTSGGSGDVTLAGAATLGADLTIETGGNDATLNGTIADDGNAATSADLAIDSSGATTIAGAVSAESVATDDGGTLALNANVTTTAGQTYAEDSITLAATLSDASATGGTGIVIGDADAGDAFRVTGPSSIRATGGDDLIQLNAATTLAGDLTLDAGANALTLDVTIDDDANAATSGDLVFDARTLLLDANIGDASPVESFTVNLIPGAGGSLLPTDVIEFDRATAIHTRGLLSLNGNNLAGRTATDATIFKTARFLTENLTLTLDSTAGDVRFGSGEKLTVAGDLTIAAGGVTAVSDINAVDVTIVAGTRIEIVGRPPGTASNGDFDLGADIVANTLTLDAPSLIVTGGQGRVQFGLPNAGRQGELVDVNNLLNVPFVTRAAFEQASVGVLPADLVDPVTLVAIDYTPGGPAPGSQRPPANPLAVLLEKPSGGVNIAAASERPLRESEVSAFLSCDPSDLECQSEAVGEARANSAQAQELRDAFSDLFGPTGGADTTALAAANEDPQKAVLDRAVQAYRAQTGQAPTGVAFRQFCQSSGDYAGALRVLEDLRELFTSAREFGMTGEGIGDFKQQTLQAVAPEGIAIDALDAAIEAGAVNP